MKIRRRERNTRSGWGPCRQLWCPRGRSKAWDVLKITMSHRGHDRLDDQNLGNPELEVLLLISSTVARRDSKLWRSTKMVFMNLVRWQVLHWNYFLIWGNIFWHKQGLAAWWWRRRWLYRDPRLSWRPGLDCSRRGPTCPRRSWWRHLLVVLVVNNTRLPPVRRDDDHRSHVSEFKETNSKSSVIKLKSTLERWCLSL